MSNYIQKCIDECKAKNPGEVEFHQTVEEVLTSLIPVIEQHPEYEECALLERLTEPDTVMVLLSTFFRKKTPPRIVI